MNLIQALIVAVVGSAFKLLLPDFWKKVKAFFIKRVGTRNKKRVKKPTKTVCCANLSSLPKIQNYALEDLRNRIEDLNFKNYVSSDLRDAVMRHQLMMDDLKQKINPNIM